MEVKPWKKIGKPETLAQSRGRSLILQKFQDPNTHNVEDYTLFEAIGFASIVLALTTENKVLAVKQYRHATDTISIELPGGNRKFDGQLPEAVAREELAEETMGYEPGTVIPLMAGGSFFESGYISFPFYPFLFTGCKQSNTNSKPDKGEYIELIKIPLQEWLSMCFGGQVRDLKSIAVTALSLNYL